METSYIESDAANSVTGAASSKRKKTASNGDGHQPQKSRRVLACDTCRRIKSRCDFDVTAGSCNRCKNLRLECSLQSLKRSTPDVRPDIRQDDHTSSLIKELKERIEEQNMMLKELKEMVSNAPTYLSSNSGAEPSLARTAIHRQLSSSHGSEALEDQKPTFPADQDTQSAPVSIIRSVNGRMNAGLNRLFNGTLKDGVNQAILSQAVAEDLLKAFFNRAGRWLQFENWEVMNVDGDARRNAPLLYATCCLQGGRLTESFCNTVAHETLYEQVRSMLGQVLMVSPLPIESVYALALMAIWGIAPKGKSEYIDSWLFSGYCVQQSMLSINFTRIMANVAAGQSSVYERTALRLWNIVCLCHLHFAVGTGRPSVIASTYLDQCPSILNIYESTTQDRMIVAEILLYSTLQKLLTRSFPLETDGSCIELETWNKKWGHLFEIKDDRARAFQISYHFAYLVIAQRSLKQLPSPFPNPPTHSHPVSPKANITLSQIRQQYIHLSCDYATHLLKIIRTLANTTLKELPENIHLSVAYSMMVLSEHLEECRDVRETVKLLQEVLVYYSQATPKTVAIVEFAVARLGHGHSRIGEQNQTQIPTATVQEGSGGMEGAAGFDGGFAVGFEGDADWGFPTLEDLFSGSFGNSIPWDVQNFEL